MHLDTVALLVLVAYIAWSIGAYVGVRWERATNLETHVCEHSCLRDARGRFVKHNAG